VGELAAAIGAENEKGISIRLGRRWAYQWRTAIVTASEEEWREMIAFLAWRLGGELAAKPAIKVGGEVLEWLPDPRELFGVPLVSL
jgi:hypothetical protein